MSVSRRVIVWYTHPSDELDAVIDFEGEVFDSVCDQLQETGMGNISIIAGPGDENEE